MSLRVIAGLDIRRVREQSLLDEIFFEQQRDEAAEVAEVREIQQLNLPQSGAELEIASRVELGRAFA